MNEKTRLFAIFIAAAILGTGCDRTATAGPSATVRDAGLPAAQACRAAIASQMGLAVAEVAIRDVTRSEAGVGVRATVDGADAPWECMTDPEGQIQAVTFIGVEADN
jgi:hypothetical protein